MRDNLEQIWGKTATRRWRHLDYTDSVRKNVDILKTCLSSVDKSKISTIVDWGPGGGWLSCLFPQCEINLVDIAESNLLESKKNVSSSASIVNTHYLSSLGSIQELGTLSSDLILAFSVIYHFPSLEYWKEVSDTWKQISPKYIIGKTFVTDGPTWERKDGEYFNNNNFLRGIVLNKKEFLNTFPHYSLVYENKITHTKGVIGSPSDQYNLIFVLEKK